MAWFVPGDPAGLAALSGASYLPAWDALLAATPAWPFGTFMPNAAMWLGNEPSLLIPWQALWAPPLGAARAQRAVRDALAANYNTRFDGVPGNDDYGTMAAWTVWALLGIYPIVGTEWYALAAPTFANATAGGLRVLARNASAGAPFVSAILLNGARLGMPFARHAELLAPPAVLEFVMTDAPVAWDYAPPV
jgi:putative alpha-1,2-mannosidase